MTDERTIKSPLPGTLYRRANPTAAPFVSEGDPVKPGDVVALIEVMKTFHEVVADEEGVVDRFLVEDEAEIEVDQDILALRD
jgi:acetyl-CoA carboxylase biotin carboxyl carrier protein